MKNRRIMSVLGLAAAAAVALSACGSDSGAPGVPSGGGASVSPTSSAPVAAPSTDASASQPATSAPVASPSESTSAPAETTQAPTSAASTPATSAPPAAGTGKVEKKKASSAVVKDPVLGDTVQATEVAWGFTGSGTWATPPAGMTYVGVKLKVTSGAKYYTGITCSTVQLGTPDTKPTTSMTSSVKADMVKQGLADLKPAAPGEDTEGYCMYYVKNPTDSNLVLQYSRLGLKGGGKTYPEFKKDMSLKVG